MHITLYQIYNLQFKLTVVRKDFLQNYLTESRSMIIPTTKHAADGLATTTTTTTTNFTKCGLKIAQERYILINRPKMPIPQMINR